MYFLFTDDENFHYELSAKTFLGAVREAKGIFSIKGRVRCVQDTGDSKEYRLINSDYSFSIRMV